MATVDPLLAQWLQSPGLSALAEDASLKLRWGRSALTTERSTTLATKEAAEAEGARVLAFRGAALAEEVAELPGAFVDTIGETITVIHPDLGYAEGQDVFVIGAEDDRASNTSRVTFLRRL